MAANYVLGLGNVLMGDDGFGPAVVHAIESAYELEGDVDVVDLGTPGLDLTPWFADADRIFLIDTVKSRLPPGTRRVYSKADLLRHTPSDRVSPHDPGVKETLLALEFAGRAPWEVTLFGVVPLQTELGVALSAPVRDAAAPTVAAVLAALQRAGIAVRHRRVPLASSAWTAFTR